MLYDFLNDFIYMENHLWNAYNNNDREELIKLRDRYMEQDKFNVEE